MAKPSKRVRAIQEKVQVGKLYPISEAIALLKEFSSVKFTETVDVAVNLGIDPRKSDQAVRGATTLPNGTGKTVRVAVFTQGDSAEAARAAGADLVGMEDLAEQIKAGNMVTAVKNAKAGQVRFRADKNGIIHGGIGSLSFEAGALKQNLEALIADLKKIKPASAKGIYVKKVTISSTMGPGLIIDQASLEA